MDYKKVIEDYKNGTIDASKTQLIMGDDDGYWEHTDKNNSEDENEDIMDALAEKYGAPEGYSDLVDILVAAGVNADWC